MTKHKFAKYKYAKEPAIRSMLVDDRIAALEKYLSIINVQIAISDDEEKKASLERKRREAEEMLQRAKKLLNSGGRQN